MSAYTTSSSAYPTRPGTVSGALSSPARMFQPARSPNSNAQAREGRPAPRIWSPKASPNVLANVGKLTLPPPFSPTRYPNKMSPTSSPSSNEDRVCLSKPKGLKLVFLDIDGVICCNPHCRLEQAKLSLLARICKVTDAKVVLSSDWRRTGGGRSMVKEALEMKGIEMIGFTPIMPQQGMCRPVEIVKWLVRNAKLAKDGRLNRLPVINYVTLDDRELLCERWGEKLSGHTVKTIYKRGLTPQLAEHAITALDDEGLYVNFH